MSIVLENFKRKFDKYEDYYKILDLKRENITDEDVQKSYRDKVNKFNKFFSGLDNNSEVLEIKDMILTSLKDAYMALKDEYSRKNYNILLENIKDKEEQKEVEDER